MRPLQRYERDLEAGGFAADPAQERVVRELDRLYADLAGGAADGGGVVTRLLRDMVGAGRRETVTGAYLWGGVGRGKTHFVNAFHESLPFEDKLRVHFHSFMQHVHHELKQLKRESDPLQTVADRLAARARVVSLDEFHVSDIADAMLLGRLLRSLFERGVTLVATSNIAPDDLYRDGLQRERFLPAIRLIKKRTRVIELDGDTDYRLRALEQAEIYHAPLDAEAERSLQRSFSKLGPENECEAQVLEIEGRPVRSVRSADGIAWFEFGELCEAPRSAADYIEIARRFHTVMLANVPAMGKSDSDKALRFIHLVDALYDRNVNLIVSAEAHPDALYTGTRLAAPFERTRSRLTEMQAREYLARKHLP